MQRVLILVLAAGWALFVVPAKAAEPRVIDEKLHHLGDNRIDGWAADASADPEGPKLTVSFESQTNTAPLTLEIRQQDIHDARWSVQLNGKSLGQLRTGKDSRRIHLEIPAGLLKDGSNALTVENPKGWQDDILVGDIRIHNQPLREFLKLGSVHLIVLNEADGAAMPARVTVLTADGEPATLFSASNDTMAVRRGLVYLSDRPADIDLEAGSYVFYATRGTEWSLARAEQVLAENGRAEVKLTLRREVDTTGFIAADTHIHTLTHSGHGDSSVTERMITLAGEGVELAIATDHNHHTDYTPEQTRLELNRYFTPVTGSEVTTRIGHVNAFPLEATDRRPDPNPKPATWVRLVEDIRGHGAKVVILNHPHYPYLKESGAPWGPFGEEQYDRATGSFGTGVVFPFDGIEVINSECPAHQKENHPLHGLEDWLGLLNHGETVKAVGSSDSHTVGDPVGQGRTYVPSATDDPSRIDIDAACEAFRAGRTTISLGIVTDIRVAEKFGPGDLHAVKPGGDIPLRVRVASASWIHPKTVSIYLNGRKVSEKTVERQEGAPVDLWMEFAVPAPRYDAHLVAVTMGDPVREPWWKTTWGATLAVTNPVWVDVDGDGRYRSPRDSARARLPEAPSAPDALLEFLSREDPVIGVQIVDLLLARADDTARPPLLDVLKKLGEKDPLYRAVAERGW